LIDSYPDSYRSDAVLVNISASASWLQGAGQSFTASVCTLDSVKFCLRKYASPTGSAYAKIYNYTGVPGSTAKPTGAALATSDAFDVATLTTSWTLTTLTFSGAQRIDLAAQDYIVVFEYGGGSDLNYVGLGNDGDSPVDDGNGSYLQSSVWSVSSGDRIFYVYGVE